MFCPGRDHLSIWSQPFLVFELSCVPSCTLSGCNLFTSGDVAYDLGMSLIREINQLRRFIAAYKKLIDRPRNDASRPEERYHQIDFELWQERLKMLEAQCKQEKLLSKGQNRRLEARRDARQELERKKSKG